MPLTIAEFGDLVGWGKGTNNYKYSLKALKELTPEKIQQLKDAGLSREMIEQWVDVYDSARVNGKGGLTARGRYLYMKEILKSWGC